MFQWINGIGVMHCLILQLVLMTVMINNDIAVKAVSESDGLAPNHLTTTGSDVTSSELSSSINVLLIGNSYTFYNDLHLILQDLLTEGYARNEGLAAKVQVTLVAEGGVDFMTHYGNANTPHDDSLERKYLVDELEESSNGNQEFPEKKRWDWVVLQDQSQLPGFFASPDPDISVNFEDSLYACKGLHRLIGEHRTTNNSSKTTTTVLYETWGNMEGSAHPETSGIYPDFSAMQKLISEGYRRYQKEVSTIDNPVPVAPVGTAFAVVHNSLMAQGLNALEIESDFGQLYYAKDHKHPSIWGSFLAAHVLYATMTGWDPKQLSYQPPPKQLDRQNKSHDVRASNDSDSETMAAMLRAVAAHVVLEEPLLAHIPHAATETLVGAKDSASVELENTATTQVEDETVQRRPMPLN